MSLPVNPMSVPHPPSFPRETESPGDFTHRVSVAARRALHMEAAAAPKPGLVDRFDSGAHSDMNLSTLLRSAKVLEPFFEKMYRSGFPAGERGDGRLLSKPREVFHRARAIGLEAEHAMFRATSGVNTHKGAIFTLGLLVTSLGYLEASDAAPVVTADAVLDCAAKMVEGIVDRELAVPTPAGDPGRETAGERLYRQYGVRGIRGEAEDGFPSLHRIGVPVIAEERRRGSTADEYCVQTLLHLMTVVEDTNVIARGGLDALDLIRTWARQVLDEGGVHSREGWGMIKEMNREFIARNISPGGSADLLSAALFLHGLELQSAYE